MSGTRSSLKLLPSDWLPLSTASSPPGRAPDSQKRRFVSACGLRNNDRQQRWSETATTLTPGPGKRKRRLNSVKHRSASIKRFPPHSSFHLLICFSNVRASPLGKLSALPKTFSTFDLTPARPDPVLLSSVGRAFGAKCDGWHSEVHSIFGKLLA